MKHISKKELTRRKTQSDEQKNKVLNIPCIPLEAILGTDEEFQEAFVTAVAKKILKTED